MTINNTFSKNNSVTDADTKARNPLKKAYCISNKTFVVIDDSIVKHFNIDEENTWFEQEQIENGIVLRIHRISSTVSKEINI